MNITVEDNFWSRSGSCNEGQERSIHHIGVGISEIGWRADISARKAQLRQGGTGHRIRLTLLIVPQSGRFRGLVPEENSELSNLKALPWWSYPKRPPAEIWCDVFAAELLLPYRLFKPLAEEALISLASVDDLAGLFLASITATGSRFAAVISAPCAFVLSEQGKVRYASRSGALRDANAWIAPRIDLPRGSVSEKARAGGAGEGPEKLDADIWFCDWERGGVLLEEVRHLGRWDQTLTLLWFEDEEIPPPNRELREDEEELGLQELDGNLRWPSKKRRR